MLLVAAYCYAFVIRFTSYILHKYDDHHANLGKPDVCANNNFAVSKFRLCGKPSRHDIFEAFCRALAFMSIA